jgi:cellulose synthase/poly-beta-1,6-N-acetylglucosamine synthase-like glycosyltransferase
VPLIVHGSAWLALPVIALQGVLVLGYLVWLLRGAPGVSPSVRRPATWPRVDIIVPVRNEARWIEGKLRNLAELRYPVESVRVFVVDGASTDATANIVAAHVARDSRVSLVRFPMADKIAQLNAGLRRGDAEWIVVTDADARLPVETLEQLMATGEADPSVAVVGAPVTPAGPLALEALHWRLGNYLRGREGRRGCASLVAGPCFAFRRGLLSAWPGDAVADDMHVTFAAMTAGRRVQLIDVAVTELRSPRHLAELFRHKFRRAHAYLREVFRFLPRVPSMPSPARTVFLWRAAHLTILPLLLLVTAGLGLAAIGHVVTSPAGTLAIGVGMVVVAAAWWASRRVQSLATIVALGALITVALVFALAALPFWRQRACFPKVAAAGQPAGEVVR